MRWTDVDGDYIDCTDGVWTCCGQEVSRLTSAVSECLLQAWADTKYCGSVGPLKQSEMDDILALWDSAKPQSTADKYSPKAEKRNPRELSLDLRDRLEILILSDVGAVARVWSELQCPELSISLHRVLVAGAAQYGAESWHTAPDAVNMYTAAMLRHYLWEIYYPGSEGIDESGHPHDAHALANCVILTDLMKGKE